MSLWKQVVLSVVVLLIAGGGWYAFQHRDTLFGASTGGAGVAAGSNGGGARRQGGGAGNFGPTLVVTDPVASDTVSEDVRAVGTVLVPQSVNIYPQVTAMVTSVDFKAGDAVKKDQLLVHLDDADQKVALELAQVTQSDAQKTLDRSQKLASTNNLTLSALQDAQSALTKAQIALYGAQVALDRRSITAPFDGVVGISNLAIGDLVTPTMIVATLDDMSVMKVSFLIPERFSGRVALDQPITAQTSSEPDKTIDGKVTAIDTRVDPTARTLKVEATIDAAAAAALGVKPGMSIEVRLPFKGAKVLAISALAIQWDRNGSYVWKVQGDGVKRVPITILERQSGRVLVASDALSDGEKIVVEGLQRLRDGMKVAEAGAEGWAASPAAKGS